MPYKYDKKLNRYRNASGEVVDPADVRRAIERVVEVVKADMRQAAQRLANGDINLPQFQIDMRAHLKTAHSLAASIGKGGRKQMTARDWAAVGNDLKAQYRYLDRLAREIEQGKVSSVQLANRAQAYANGLRASYYRQATESERTAGKRFSKRQINSREGCAECASWAAKGFIAIDEQPPIGGLICKSFCRCWLIYK